MKISDILLESYSDAKRIFSQETDKETVSKYLDTFKDLTNRNIIKGQEKDISYWIKQGWGSFKQLVDDNREVQSSSEVKKSKKKDSIVVYEDEDKMIVIPLTKEASIYYGKNTKWCTSATKSENKFYDYFIEGAVLFYVLLANGDKYAAAMYIDHEAYESFDAQDNSISAIEFRKVTRVDLTTMKGWYEQYEPTITKYRKEGIRHIQQGILDSGKSYETYEYALDVIKGPWPEGEGNITKNPLISSAYAANVLKGPFPKGEGVIATDATASYRYATNVLKGPFYKGEDAMSNGALISSHYHKFLQDNGFKKDAEAFKNKYM